MPLAHPQPPLSLGPVPRYALDTAVATYAVADAEARATAQQIIEDILSEKFSEKKQLNNKDFDVKFEKLVDLINLNAPIKIISKNKKEKEILL